MRLRLVPLVAVLVAAASACGSSPSASPSPALTTTTDSVPSSPTTSGATEVQVPSLRAAVQAYSDAYLTGEGEAAFAMLSKTCQVQIGRDSFVQVVTAAKQAFGHKLALSSFSSKTIDATHALVTYTYPVPSIDQHDQRWSMVDGAWKYDAC